MTPDPFSTLPESAEAGGIVVRGKTALDAAERLVATLKARPDVVPAVPFPGRVADASPTRVAPQDRPSTRAGAVHGRGRRS